MLSVRQVRPRNGSLRPPLKKTLGSAQLSLARYLSINAKKEQFTGLSFWRPKTAEETTALSLSGGGSKGSFQVGTLHFFDKSGLWSKFNVTRIASSSVGSVNGLKLAEGRKQSIPEMLKIWMELKFPSDMYSKTKELKNVEAELDSGLIAIGANELFSGIFSIGNAITDDIGNLIRNGSLFTLKPTREKLSANVDFNKVKNSKIDLRLVASEQRTQRPVAFTKNGELIRPRNETVPIPHTNWSLFEKVSLKRTPGNTSFKDRMLNAVEASAAIPGVFPIVTAIETIKGKEWTGFYVDGGVNDILPKRYAGTLNGIDSTLSHEPKHFLSIFAGTVDVDNEAAPIEEKNLYRQQYALPTENSNATIVTGGAGNVAKDPLNFPTIRPSWRWRDANAKPNLIENITRGLFSALSEVSRGDMTEGQEGRGKTITIRPYQAVHGTVEVHPGKLRINAAYGYMSAFDKLLIASDTLSKKEENHLLTTSYEITRRRVLTVKRQEIAIYKIIYFFLRNQKFGSQKYVDKFLALIDEHPAIGLRKLEKAMLSFSMAINGNNNSVAVRNMAEFSKIVPKNMIFEAATLKRIRQDKKAIAELVISRVQHFGLGSVPINMDKSQNSERKRHNTVASWWTEFELSNRNSVFLVRPLNKRQQVGTVKSNSREKDASFNIAPSNLPIDIVKALS